MRKYMSKRQRPCDFCRSRKTACRIEGSPPCRSCQLHAKECTFVEAARPRKKHMAADAFAGSFAEAVVDEHEPVGASIEGVGGEVSLGVSVPDVDDAPSLTDAPNAESFPEMSMQFLDNLDMDGSEYRFMFRSPASNPSPTADVSATSQSQSPSTSHPTDSSDILLDGTGGLNPETLGLTGHMDPYLLQSYQFDHAGTFKFKQLAIQSVQQDPVPVQFLVSQPSLFAKSREEAGHDVVPESEFRSRLEKEVSEPMGKRLITLYQRFIAPQYPIFSTQLPPDPASTPSHLLAAIYSISFPFAIYDDKLCIDLAYDSPPYASLSRIINAALAAELHSPSIALVQTLLLVVARPSSNPLVSDASCRWSMLGLLVAAAVNIGLHLDPLAWKISSSQICQRRRLSFAVYATDKWLAASLGRPPHINNENWLVTSLRPSDVHDSELSDEQWTEMLDMSSLTDVLASTLSGLYSLRAMQSLADDPQGVVHIATKLTQALELIRYARNTDTQTSQSQPSMLQIVLTLSYHQITLLILRSTIRSFLASESGAINPSSPDSRESLRNRLKDGLVNFANFIKTLKTDEINGFWPPWCQSAFSSLCYTQLLMIVSSPNYDEAMSYIDLLQQTRRQLRLKSVSLPVLRLGLLRVDSIFWRGVEKVLKLEPHVVDAFRASQST